MHCGDYSLTISAAQRSSNKHSNMQQAPYLNRQSRIRFTLLLRNFDEEVYWKSWAMEEWSIFEDGQMCSK